MGYELDGLIVAFFARGLDAVFLELVDDVAFGFAQALAASVAAFHIVVGEDLDMVPPGVAVEGVGCLRDGGKDESSYD